MRQSPTLGGTVIKADLSIARQAKGVTKVLDMGDSIAVVAESYWQAKQALDAIEVTWSDANYPDSDELYTLYENLLNEAKEVETYRSDGPTQAELNEFTANDLQFDYFAPYQAHMTMEPLSCTIHYSKSGAQCWYGAQIPTAVVNQISSILELDRDKVELHVPYLGGGFGRRLEGDVAMFAARIAKQLPDQPIKLLWSREEDTTHGRYRPAAMARMRCRLNDDGLPVLFAGRTVVQPVWPKFTVRNMGEEDGTGSMDATIAFGLFDQPYNFQDYQMEAIDPKISFPVGQWRSVGNSYNAFFMESMLDEISIKTDTDPFQLRQQLLKHDPVALSVLNAVKQMSGWDDLPITQGWGRGIAFSRCFGTCTAQVVSLHVNQNRVRVAKVFCAADPGPAINPDVVISQIEGGIIFGLSSALLQEITIHAGVVQQSNFDQHPALRINQAPEIKVRLLSGQTEIGGVGEIGVPAVIPAVTSAIFNAVNIRVRRLPITHSGLSLS